MKKYMIVAVGLLLGVSQLDAVKGGRPRLTRAEKISHAKDRVSYNSAIVDSLQRSGFSKKNPAAFGYATKRLSGSQTRLKNLESGKISKRRTSARAHVARSSMARNADAMRRSTATRGRTTSATTRSASRATRAKVAATTTATRPVKSGLGGFFRRHSAATQPSAAKAA